MMDIDLISTPSGLLRATFWCKFASSCALPSRSVGFPASPSEKKGVLLALSLVSMYLWYDCKANPAHPG
eukprot:scaffold12034_cov148-Skeletonema_menzelii.AAC.7